MTITMVSAKSTNRVKDILEPSSVVEPAGRIKVKGDQHSWRWAGLAFP